MQLGLFTGQPETSTAALQFTTPERYYQTEAREAAITAVAQGVKRGVISLAVGGGKTNIAAHLIPTLPAPTPRATKALFLAHREELIDQAADRIRTECPWLRVEIDQANRKASPDADVIVASVPTLGRAESDRITKFDPEDFKLIVVDETHHAAAQTYLRILDYFQAREPNSHIAVIGITATVRRSDGVGLEQVFQEILYHKGMIEMIEEGFLCSVRAIRIQTDTNIDAVKTRAGDFAADELAEAINNAERNAQIVAAYQEHVQGERQSSLVFAANTQHLLDLHDAFADAGIETRYVTHKTPKDERKETVEAFRRREFPVLLNLAVFCLDEQTEILTSGGWVDIDAMGYEHKVANWEDGKIFFKEPKFIIKRDRLPEENMVSLNASSPIHSIRVTDKHRMLCRTRSDRPFEIVHAEKMTNLKCQVPISGYADPMVFEMDQEYCSDDKTIARRITSTAYDLRTKKGLSYEDSIEEAKRRVARRVSMLKRKAPHELSLDECRFIGFWLGDGSVNKLQNGGLEYSLSQSKAYPNIISKVDQLISAIGVDVIRKEKTREGNKGSCEYIYWALPRGTGGGSQERIGLYPIEPYLKKEGTQLFWGLSKEQLGALLYGLWLADGNHGDGTGTPRSYKICGVRKALFDILQAVAVCRGYRASILEDSWNKKKCDTHKTMWNLSVSEGRSVRHINQQTMQLEEGWKNERVWCVTSHTGNIITRRNGTVTVTGNTEGTDMPMIDALLLCRPTKSSTLFTQIIGRGLRLHEGKKDCLILDFVDVCRDKELMTVPSLFGLSPDFDMEGEDAVKVFREVEELTERNPFVLDRAKTLAEAKSMVAEEFDPFRVAQPPQHVMDATEFKWFEVGSNQYRINVPSTDEDKRQAHLEVRQDMLGHWQVTLHRGKDAKEVRKRNELGIALQAAESYLRDHYSDRTVLMNRKADWHNKPVSEAQIAFMKKLYVPREEMAAALSGQMTSGRASHLIEKYKLIRNANAKRRGAKRKPVPRVDDVQVGKL